MYHVEPLDAYAKVTEYHECGDYPLDFRVRSSWVTPALGTWWSPGSAPASESKASGSSCTLQTGHIRWEGSVSCIIYLRAVCHMPCMRHGSESCVFMQFSAETEQERREWIEAIDRILKTPLVPQDNNLAVSLNKKRHDSMAFFSR